MLEFLAAGAMAMMSWAPAEKGLLYCWMICCHTKLAMVLQECVNVCGLMAADLGATTAALWHCRWQHSQGATAGHATDEHWGHGLAVSTLGIL